MTANTLQIEMVRKLLRHGARDRVVRILERFRPAELADFFKHLSPAEQKTFVVILHDLDQAADTIAELPDAQSADLINHLSNELLASICEQMSPDDAVYFVSQMEPEKTEAVLLLIAQPKRERINHIRHYPKESAGSLMTSEMLTLDETLTVEQAIAEIRRRAGESEFVFYVYVVNESGTFVGVVPMRRLISAAETLPLREIMVTDPIAVQASEDQEVVADLTARYNLLAVPVVDDTFMLLGVITVDDVIDVLQAEATEDIYNLQGLSGEDRVYSPISTSIKKRFPWMVFNLCAVFATAAIVGIFETSIAEVVILATFMPVVANMGGNGGTQTLTVVTRAMALGELDPKDARVAILKQLGIGFCVGAGIGLITGILAYLWRGNPALGLVLFASMMINMSIAGLVGAAVPVALKRLNQDPALGGGIITTTFTDMIGFVAFLGLATIFIDYL